MISFKNDYSEGALPEIMEALVQSNLESTVGYGMDEYCAKAAEKIKKRINRPDAQVHFLVGGTQANQTCISAFLRSYEAVIGVKTAHINPHTANIKQWNVSLVHKVFGYYCFDDILFEYIFYKEKFNREETENA